MANPKICIEKVPTGIKQQIVGDTTDLAIVVCIVMHYNNGFKVIIDKAVMAYESGMFDPNKKQP